MRKFLILTAGILCMAGSTFAGDEMAEVAGDEGEQFIDAQGLPKAQIPDIENRLVSKKADVHAKAEAKKSELGVKDDVTLSSLGISEAKLPVVSDAVKSVQVPSAKNKDTQKTSEVEMKAGDKLEKTATEPEVLSNKEIESDQEKMAEAEEEAEKLEEEIKEIENSTVTTEEKTNKADDEVKAHEVDDKAIEPISDGIDDMEDIEEGKPDTQNAEDTQTPEKADGDAKESKSVFDELDDIF